MNTLAREDTFPASGPTSKRLESSPTAASRMPPDSDKSRGVAGGHAVKAHGWGVDNGTPYWIIQNSWGSDWGLSGFFWIARGTDECGIEDQMYGGLPLTN